MRNPDRQYSKVNPTPCSGFVVTFVAGGGGGGGDWKDVKKSVREVKLELLVES